MKSHLLVESSNMHSFIIKKLLKKIGYKATIVKKTNDVVDIILNNNNKYSIIWTDINFPGDDGLNLTKKLREELHYKGVIIGITGYCDIDTIQDCKKAGMDAILKKPVNLEELKLYAKKYST